MFPLLRKLHIDCRTHLLAFSCFWTNRDNFAADRISRNFICCLSFRAVVLKVVDIDPRGQVDHPRGR